MPEERDATAPAVRVSSPASLREAPRAADRYTALVEAADDAVIVADFDSRRVVEANPAACELFGFSREEFPTMAVRDLHFGDEEVDRVLTELAERERATHPNLK